MVVSVLGDVTPEFSLKMGFIVSLWWCPRGKCEAQGLESSGGLPGRGDKGSRCFSWKQEVCPLWASSYRKELALCGSHKLQVCVSKRTAKHSFPIPTPCSPRWPLNHFPSPSVCLFWAFHINEIVWFVVLCDWLLSLSTVLSRFTYVWCWFSCYVVSDSLQPHGLYPASLLCPWDFPGKNTGVGCHFLLQGIFPTEGSNLGLLHCRRILYQLSHQGSPSPCIAHIGTCSFHINSWIYSGLPKWC